MLDMFAADESADPALRCAVSEVSADSRSMQRLRQMVAEDAERTAPGDERPLIRIRRVFQLRRPGEDAAFAPHAGPGANARLLFHATRSSNAFGILARGLLLPRIVTSQYGGTRRDAGMLGSGIYFADRPSTSAAYSTPCVSSTARDARVGPRFMFVSEVALGNVFHTHQRDESLISPPEGLFLFASVLFVITPFIHTFFSLP